MSTGRARSTAVVIVGAGRASRFGGRTPKQFARLEGRPLLRWSVDCLSGVPGIGQVVLVVPERQRFRIRGMFSRSGFSGNLTVVGGGSERQDSVWNGLKALDPEPDFVLIHDAARPLVARRLVRMLLQEARSYPAVVPALPVTDTLKREGPEGFLAETVDRSLLWTVQTPQCFHFDLIVRAHRQAGRSGVKATDDAALVEILGIPVRMIPGSTENIKITTQADLMLAEMYLKRAKRGRRGGLQL